MTVKKTFKYGLQVTPKRFVFYKAWVPIRDMMYPVSKQVTPYQFKGCAEHSYNFGGRVVVVVISNTSIVILPNTFKVRYVLNNEGYHLDERIAIPPISLDTLEKPKQKRRWSKAIMRLS